MLTSIRNVRFYIKNALEYNVYHRCLCYFLHQIKVAAFVMCITSSSVSLEIGCKLSICDHIVPEKGWFGQPKYSTPLKSILRCIGSCSKYLASQLVIDPYHSLSKQKILPVEPLIQCEAGRAKTMQRQSLYSPRTPKWPPSDKRELRRSDQATSPTYADRKIVHGYLLQNSGIFSQNSEILATTSYSKNPRVNKDV